MLKWDYDQDIFKADCLLGLRNEVIKVLSLYEQWIFSYPDFENYVENRLIKDFEVMTICTGIDLIGMYKQAIKQRDLYGEVLPLLVLDLHRLACTYCS